MAQKRTYSRGQSVGSLGKGGGGWLIFLLLIIATGGGYLAYEYFRKPKYDPKPDGKGDAEPAKETPPPPQQLPEQKAEVKEVNNDYFRDNPYAYVDGVESLNIRKTPGEAGAVIFTAKKGQYIGKHTGKSADIGWPTSPGRWAKIDLVSGGQGWVFSGYLKSEKSQRSTIALQPAPAPSTPSTPRGRSGAAFVASDNALHSGPAVGTLKKGTKPDVIGSSGDWVQLRSGWVYKGVLENGIAKADANVWPTAGLAFLRKGQEVALTGNVSATPLGTFSELIAEGRKGWVLSSLLLESKPLNGVTKRVLIA